MPDDLSPELPGHAATAERAPAGMPPALLPMPMLSPGALCTNPLPELRDDEIHVLAFRLTDTPEAMRSWMRRLVPAERAQAARFAQPLHRDRHVIAHAVLREILARYVGTSPERLVIEREAGGKPGLSASHRSDVTFNLAHSDDYALLAVSRRRAIGVDLEGQRQDIDTMAIASRFFFGAERDWLLRLPREARQRACFRLWVAKEAVLKGDGIGLQLPLDRFAVRCDLETTSVPVESHDPARLAADWRVEMLTLPPRWCGAVAARGAGWRVVLPPFAHALTAARRGA